MALLVRLVLALLLICFLVPEKGFSKMLLNGAGATFPYPLYLKMLDVYKKETGVQVNYQAIGSGGGIRNILSGMVDFAGSDAVLSEKEEKELSTPILHIPTVVGSVVLAYNVPLRGKAPLILTPEVLEKIYSGEITKWNDPAIIAKNPNRELPNLAITPVYRADGSGTTYIFTEYLSAVSTDWAEVFGFDKSISWATGVGQKGNSGIAGFIKATAGSIGYLELGYAEQNKLHIASIYNKANRLITPKNILAATTNAANIASLPNNLKVSLVNSSNPDASPIASFTWILLRQEQNYNNRTLENAKATKAFVKWVLTKGQQYALPLYYAPLSLTAQKKALQLLERLTYNGKPL